MIQVGDRVVCVDASDCYDPLTGGESPLIEGREYIVYSMKTKCKCGIVVDVGVEGYRHPMRIVGYPARCIRCNDIYPYESVWWFGIRRFRKVSESTAQKVIEYTAEIKIDIPEPVLS